LDYKKCSDNELVSACKKQIRQAQQELFMRFSYMMKGVCLRYAQDEAEAEDVLQESFIRIFKNLDQYTEKGALGAWARKITVNTALEHYRKNKSIRHHLSQVFEMTDFNPTANDNAIEQLNLEALLGKIQRLPAGFRTVFNLYAIEGYTHQEIGDLLGISDGTSKSQYSRARLLLREMIDKESAEDGTYNAWSYAK
jgi:RNA polymerase sigma factor (sigma-70 family)